MEKKLLSLDEIYNLDISKTKAFYSDFLNINQSKMLSKFSYGRDKFIKAEGVYLYTDSGKKILDFSGGIGVLNHGHNNQAVLDSRIDFQNNKRMEVHKTVFSPYMAGLAHNIAQLLPKNLCKSFFCNSGSESVEGAIKAAYKFHNSKRKYILHSDIVHNNINITFFSNFRSSNTRFNYYIYWFIFFIFTFISKKNFKFTK